MRAKSLTALFASWLDHAPVYGTSTSRVSQFIPIWLISPDLNVLTDCVLLTDMSVFELSALPKLRRVGLVRVNQLTDEAIYALAERHATLERIHLSYCDQISVMAIHFLLLKLHKLTHLSLTGVTAFRQQELQQFCREAPKVCVPSIQI